MAICTGLDSLTPLLECIHGEKCTRIMAELHEGTCGSHVGGRALAARTLRAGYYWPSMREDCKKYAQCCKQCQQHADWPRAIDQLQLLGRCLVPIGVLPALFAALSILLAIFSHRWPIVACTESPRGQSSTPDVASTYTFMELCHNSRALLAVYTFQEWVSENPNLYRSPSINVYLLEFFFTFLASVGSSGWRPSAKHRLYCVIQVSGSWAAQTCITSTFSPRHALILGDLKVSCVKDLWLLAALSVDLLI